jgi:GNAT superfamily N-acetyltransferase
MQSTWHGSGRTRGTQAELLRLYVQEPFTGKHVGSMLLSEVERLATKCGTSVLWLTPWAHNHRARAFYERRQYKDYGLTSFVFEGETHENKVYAKHLRAASAA